MPQISIVELLAKSRKTFGNPTDSMPSHLTILVPFIHLPIATPKTLSTARYAIAGTNPIDQYPCGTSLLSAATNSRQYAARVTQTIKTESIVHPNMRQAILLELLGIIP